MKRYLWVFFIIIINLIVLFLYGVEVEPALYAAVICLILMLIVFLVELYYSKKKHLSLEEMKAKIIYEIEGLPVPSNRIEKDYQEIITILNEYKNQTVNQSENSRSDMEDYYALWVHQIKVPIAAMRLLLQSKQESNKESREEDSKLLAEIFRVEQYVEMALTYMKLESGSTDYVIKEYDLNSIMKQALRKYAPLFIQKKIILSYEEIDIRILTDEKWFLFVIEQLLSNALKYTRKGAIKIYCNENELVIEDTGIGIAKEDLPRIGEKGFTGYNGRTDKKSTGLGIYLSKRILRKLSHTMIIESEVSVGTRVRIQFEMC